MKSVFRIFLFLIVSFLAIPFDPLSGETIVRVVIPNVSKTDGNAVSMKGRLECERNGSINREPLQFNLESFVGKRMTWSAVVPTIFDLDRMSVGVDIDIDSETETLHDIISSQIDQGGVVTFFRWIFIKKPEVSDLDMSNFEDYFSTSPVRYDTVGVEDSISIHLDGLLTGLFSENTDLRQNPEMVIWNVWNYTKLIPFLDYQDLTQDEVKSKLQTTLIHFFEEITFYDYFIQFSFECSLDETGQYLQVDLYLK